MFCLCSKRLSTVKINWLSQTFSIQSIANQMEMSCNQFFQLTYNFQNQWSENWWRLKCTFHLLCTSFVDPLDPKGMNSDTTSSNEQISQLVGRESQSTQEVLKM